MAKGKKGESYELDDFKLDDSLDMEGFDFDGPEIKDDRSAVISVAGGFKDGVVNTVLSADMVRKFVKEGMPKGYGQALDLADKTAGSLRGLYNETAKELKPAIKDLKRVTGRVLPSVAGVLPKSVSEKIKSWSEDKDSRRSALLDAETQRDNNITMQLGDIFKMESEERAKEGAEQDAKDLLREGADQARHRDQLAQLDEMRLSLSKLANYKTKVESAYQRKSLELQFRHFFVAKDLLEESRQQNVIVKTNLEGIMKNTGLPEFVKLKNSERLKEMLRNEFVGGLNDNIFAGRREMISNLTKNVVGIAKDKIMGTINGVKDGLSGADSMLDLAEMQKEMGVNGKRVGGEMVGGIVADNVITRGAKWVKKNVMDKSDKANKIGNDLSYGIENAPQLLEEWSKNTDPSKIPFADFLKEVAGRSVTREKTDLSVDNAGSMREADLFNRETNKSINNIIPTYLSKIHQELRIIRTGDTSIEPLMFDHLKGKFNTRSEVKKNIAESLFNKGNKEYGDRFSSELIKKVDTENALSEDEQKLLAKILTKRNMMEGKAADPNKLSSGDAYMELGVDMDTADKFADVFKKFYGEDKRGEKKNTFARDYRRLGDYTDDKRSNIQDQVNLGNSELLRELGLITEDGKNINMERLRDIQLNGLPPGLGEQFGPPSPFGSGQPANSFGPSLPSPAPSNVPPLVNPQAPIVNVDQDTLDNLATELKKAITENSSKSINEIMSETLLRIEEQLKQGIPFSGLGGNGGGGGPGGGGLLNQSLGSLFGKAFGAAKKGAGFASGALSSGAKTGFSFAKKALGFGKDAAKEGFGFLKKKYSELGDIYIKGEVTPRLLKWKLEAGHYVDKTTGEVIKKMSDIKGDVIDTLDPDNLVLRGIETKNAFMKSSGVKKLLELPKSIADNAAKLGGFVMGKLPAAYAMGLKLVNKAYGLLSLPQDVYVAGKEDPVMLAVTMKAGGYTSKISGKPVTNPGEIDGPILDNDGNIVLTAEDLAGGIFDKHGKPIRTGWKKLVGMGKDILTGMANRAKKIGGWVKDKLTSGWNTLRRNTPDGIPMPSLGGMSGKRTNTILKQIRDILNTRLPGEPSKFDDSEDEKSLSGAIGAGIKSGVNKLKDKAKELKAKFDEQGGVKTIKDKLLGIKDKTKDKAKGVFDKLTKKDGIAVSGMDKLVASFAELKKYLKDGKKKIAGDTDGDGIRDGSFADLMRRRKERKNAGVGQVKENKWSGKSLLETGKDAAMGLYDKATGAYDTYRDYKDARGNDGGDNTPDRRGPPQEDGDVHRRPGESKNQHRRRMMARNAAPPAPPGPKRGRLGRGIDKVKGMGSKGLGVAAKGLGLAGAAYGGYSAYENIKGGNYGSAAVDGALAAGSLYATGTTLTGLLGGAGTLATGAASIGGSLLAGAGTLFAGIGAVLASPVVLGALAVGALGAAAYYGYKYLTKEKLNTYSKYRYAQYGFSAEDDKHIGPVIGLESSLASAITTDGEKPEIDDKKVDIKKLMDSFGVDVKDKKAVSQWSSWFADRFKPVYLTHVTALRGLNPKAKLASVSTDLSTEQLTKYVELIKFPEGPYGENITPFPGEDKLVMGYRQVMDAYDVFKTEVEKETKDKKKDGGGLAAAAAVTTGAAASLSELKTKSDEGGEGDGGGLGSEDESANWTAMASSLGLGDDSNDTAGTNIKLAGVPIPGLSSGVNSVDALAAVRLKSYGLKEMEGGKVSNLFQLEKYLSKDTVVGKGGIAEWSGSFERVAKDNAISFGVGGIGTKAGTAWIKWFTMRFLPTFLNYATAVMKATGKKDLETAIMTLKPSQRLDAAMATYTTKYSFEGSTGSIWEVTDSPWPGYELNLDNKSVETNVEILKQKVKDSVIDEEASKGKNAASADNKKTISQLTKPKENVESTAAGAAAAALSPNKYGAPTPSSPVNSPVDPTRTTTMSGGSAIGDTEKGTGGAYNDLPDPQGSGSWKALKDLIMGAAKMVGVDGKLMGAMAAVESGFNYTVKAGTSSATGLYQFIKSTWDTMVKKYGPKYGIGPDTPPTDPKANAIMGAEYVKENQEALRKRVKRELTDTDIYMAHFLGAGGAGKFLTADPNAIAAEILPKAASANPSIFKNKDGSFRTVAEVYNLMGQKIKDRGAKLGLQTNTSDMKVAKVDQSSGSTDTGKPGFLNGAGGTGGDSKGAIYIDPATAVSSKKSTDTKSTPTANTAFGNIPSTNTLPVPNMVATSTSPAASPTGQSSVPQQLAQSAVRKDDPASALASVINAGNITQNQQLDVLKGIKDALDKLLVNTAKEPLPKQSSAVASTPMAGTEANTPPLSQGPIVPGLSGRQTAAPRPSISMAKKSFVS